MTPEEKAAYMREYRAKHREWMRTLYSLWYQKNGGERKRRYRAHYAVDPDFRRSELARRKKNRKRKKTK